MEAICYKEPGISSNLYELGCMLHNIIAYKGINKTLVNQIVYMSEFACSGRSSVPEFRNLNSLYP